MHCYINGSLYTSGKATLTSANDVIECFVDMSAGDVEFFVNDVSQGSYALPSGYDDAGLDLFFHCDTGIGDNTLAFDYGQLGYNPATNLAGSKRLSTTNLNEPTIKNSKKYYDTILYEGNGDSQKVGQFQPITETYTVGNSALFIKGDSTELLKTFGAVASSTKEGTLSMWLKIGQITGGAGGYVVTCGGASGDFIKIDSGLIKIQLNNETNGQWTSTNKLDDTTQWTNLVVTYDLDNVTATDRIQIYIN